MTILMGTGEVLSHKKYGEHYHSLTIVAPEVGESVRPGQFVNIRCGEGAAHILRRPFSIYRVHKRGGWASTIEIVFDIRGPGTRYLSSLRSHASIDLVGPLGRGFAMPSKRAHCLLVGGGIGAAPMFFLADELRNDGHRVDVILGARTSGLLLNQIDARRLASVCRICTEDGSAGESGRVTDLLEETIERCKTEIVYTCGPHPMMAAVSQVAMERDLPVQVAVEELMACGYGVCMTCVMPLRRKRPSGKQAEEEYVYARSCTDGPVFDGSQVIWDGTSPTSTEAVSVDQSELSPGGMPSRHGFPTEPPDEHAPPGN